MKAAHDLLLSHDDHQTIASGITSLAQDLQAFSIEPWGTSGEATHVPLDETTVRQNQYGLGTDHFGANLKYAVSPAVGKTATIDLYGKHRSENTHLVLAGDDQTWDIARGTRSNIVGSLSHTEVVHYIAGANNYENPDDLCNGDWFNDMSALTALTKIIKPTSTETVHTATVAHLDSTGFTPVEAKLLTVRRPFTTHHALSLENDFTIAIPDSNFQTDTVTRRYLYALRKPRGRMEQAAATVVLESNKVPTKLLKALAKNEQEHENIDTVTKFEHALSLLSAASLAELQFLN